MRPINAPLSPLVNTFSFCSGDPLPLPFLYEPPLHLSHHAKDGNDEVSHLSSGGYIRVKNCDAGTLLLTFVDNIQDVPRIAAQTVQSGDNQLISRSQKLDDRLKFISPRSGST